METCAKCKRQVERPCLINELPYCNSASRQGGWTCATKTIFQLICKYFPGTKEVKP